MEQNGRGKESGTIGSRIRNLRNRDGMSQEQLALLLHFENKGTISSYETDRRTVPSDVVIRLAEIFQTTTDYILRGSHPELDTLCLGRGADTPCHYSHRGGRQRAKRYGHGDQRCAALRTGSATSAARTCGTWWRQELLPPGHAR